MGEENQNDACPDRAPVDLLISGRNDPQVADEKSNLEEADSKLVDRSASEVHSRIMDEIRPGTQSDRKAKTVFGFYTRQ